jgi:curved DNA-binding protein CbpA
MQVAHILAPTTRDPYTLLRVKPDSSASEIKKRYWKVSLLVHPDKCAHPQAQQAFTVLNKAFKEVEDPAKVGPVTFLIARFSGDEKEYEFLDVA